MQSDSEPTATALDVTSRLVALERRVGQLWLGIALAAVAASAGTVLVERSIGSVGRPDLLRAHTIETSRVVLRDAKGNKRAIFEVQDDLHARLVFLRLQSDTRPYDERGHNGPVPYTAGVESWGERGHVFVREVEGLGILGGSNLMMTSSTSAGPRLILGDGWDGHMGLAIAGDGLHEWNHFPAKAIGTVPRGAGAHR